MNRLIWTDRQRDSWPLVLLAHVCALLASAALAACGGGGDDPHQPDRGTDPVQCGPAGHPQPCL